MSARIVDELRDKAKGYELNALAARERQELASSFVFQGIAIVLFDLADTFEHDLEEAA